jgi:hypothetical protein
MQFQVGTTGLLLNDSFTIMNAEWNNWAVAALT